jgi:hypothetical protein
VPACADADPFAGTRSELLKQFAMATDTHTGSATLQAPDARHTATSECDKRKSVLHEKYDTWPVLPVVELTLPFAGATRFGVHALGAQSGATLLQPFDGKHTKGFT